ncbi:MULTISPECIES: hypothetical protein [Staphylococcus]|uniref:hypothetical protein n=1 Tax=Staphylococcus TaxID=1279 RepID=UPI00044FEB0D|nr:MULTISPECIES: hypothetical protein [Staphylococcus]MDW4013816.1 hypothetical protein [Staphylococcus saprophyticus]CRV35698.1 Uncharacterised protein [Streptococcus equi subsp. equi]AKR47482.1 hypothetical protein ACO02_2807 [Staphylococcus aureus]AOH63264.1 hypothetical protein A7U52_2945 [Staphylococcus aureus]AUI14304.1 hypothetical protein A7U46_015155 [Staphylococcus aureus]
MLFIDDVVTYDGTSDYINYLNDYYETKGRNRLVENEQYYIHQIDYEYSDDEVELLYTIKNINTGVIVGFMFNEWELEKNES